MLMWYALPFLSTEEAIVVFDANKSVRKAIISNLFGTCHKRTQDL